jgi:hypothetical protein
MSKFSGMSDALLLSIVKVWKETNRIMEKLNPDNISVMCSGMTEYRQISIPSCCRTRDI